MEQLKPDLSEGRWDAVGLVQRQPVAASSLLCQPEVWTLLPDQAQSMILGHLTDPVKDESGRIIPRVVGLQQSRLLAKNSLLTQKQEEVLVAAVDAAPYQVLQQAGIPLSRIPLSRYIDRFLNDLRSHTWDRQNPAAGALIDVEPEKLSGLHSGVQVELGRNVLQAADGGSFRAADLIHTISARSERYPEDFVFGLLVETWSMRKVASVSSAATWIGLWRCRSHTKAPRSC
jgi:hypothetical protein